MICPFSGMLLVLVFYLEDVYLEYTNYNDTTTIIL